MVRELFDGSFCKRDIKCHLTLEKKSLSIMNLKLEDFKEKVLIITISQEERHVQDTGSRLFMGR